ncbi:MAG TPA: 50S ribosomal protein L18 [bacterium]|nr:50S ribosomal protein L18 [bacterium]
MSVLISQIRRKKRAKRHARIRKTVKGTAVRPRLVVNRGSKNIAAQLIDDTKGVTLAAASSFDANLRSKLKYGGNLEAAKAVGEQIAKLAKEKGLAQAVFDRGGYAFHGRIKALADAARQGGLQF